jgi:hypothetical protein
MKKFLKILFPAITMLLIISCNDSKRSGTAAITSDQITQIGAALTGAMSASGGGSYKNGTNSTVFTYTQTCDASNYKFTGTSSGSYNCEGAGHIAYTGSLLSECRQINYNSGSHTCTCTGDWVTSNSISLQMGDSSSKLNNCDAASDLVLDGTLSVAGAGTGSAIDLNMTGTISVNKRASSGALDPIASECSILITYTASTGKMTGTICGQTANSQ